MLHHLTINIGPEEIGGHKVADKYAKPAAASAIARGGVDRRYPREASVAQLSSKMTETRTYATRDWIASHVKGSRRYGPQRVAASAPPSGKSERSWLGAIISSFQGSPRLGLIWPTG